MPLKISGLSRTTDRVPDSQSSRFPLSKDMPLLSAAAERARFSLDRIHFSMDSVQFSEQKPEHDSRTGSSVERARCSQKGGQSTHHPINYGYISVYPTIHRVKTELIGQPNLMPIPLASAPISMSIPPASIPYTEGVDGLPSLMSIPAAPAPAHSTNQNEHNRTNLSSNAPNQPRQKSGRARRGREPETAKHESKRALVKAHFNEVENVVDFTISIYPKHVRSWSSDSAENHIFRRLSTIEFCAKPEERRGFLHRFLRRGQFQSSSLDDDDFTTNYSVRVTWDWEADMYWLTGELLVSDELGRFLLATRLTETVQDLFMILMGKSFSGPLIPHFRTTLGSSVLSLRKRNMKY
ncbi:hypothetical protein B0T24DRAFT_2128 [Lasiosphaeria ovina]|uniref:Uncharacterized protein n=1 Tax=Lasiosphaeria ovina TaxID=92902 RepID=A0AAE0NIM0_9PEZI|nr:hypothetical protein B0T24DRAFT_2128 [Lasiosphaeria ovina]